MKTGVWIYSICQFLYIRVCLQNHSCNLPTTLCSREGFSWFYSNIYEQKPVLDVKETVEKIKTAFAAKNVVVINMPPNIHGKLVEGDVKHLMDIGKELGILRV